MILVMKHQATAQEIEGVVAHIESLGFRAHLSQGEERTIIGVIGDERPLDPEHFEMLPGVERVVRILHPFKLASRDFHPDDSIVRINGVSVGGPPVIMMAGPCSVESRAQLMETAAAVQEAGGHILRGGAFKPRTSPYAFQGLKEQGLHYLSEARKRTGLPFVTEVLETESVELVAEHADMLQIGARNVQNFSLLKRVAECGKPVLLKRG